MQLHKIPDLSLNKYQSLADTGIDGVLKRHSNFLRQWHGICCEANASIHLLYLFNPDQMAGKRLKIYLMLQGKDDDLEMIRPLLDYSPLSDFYQLKDSEIPEIEFQACSTMMKNETLADIYNPMTAQTKMVHYVPKLEVNEESRLYDMFRIMEVIGKSYGSSEACAYRIDLYPASVAKETREKFTPVLKSLRGDNDIQLVEKNHEKDDYARDICKEYEDWLTNIETNPHFRMNIYGFAGNSFQAKVILNAVGAEAISEGNFTLANIKAEIGGIYHCISRMGSIADTYCIYSDRASLPSWSTTYTLEEVESFFRFPALYDGEVIEIPKETAPIQFENGLYIGKDENGFAVNFPIEDLPRHAFFTGTPGSGKTNTMLHIVTELRNKGIPFLALEPAKKEYRELLGYSQMQDICLFSPHLQSRFPLQMNPFEFPKGVRLSEHINALLEVFEGSFTLEGPTYKFLSSSIRSSYENLGWDIEDINEEDMNLQYPTLQDIYNNLEKEIEKSSYDGELKGNVRAFLQVRLGGLMERDAGELYNTPFSTIAPGEWLYKSAIVELEVLGEQAKNFFVLLVCHYILETLRADPQGGIDQKTGEKVPVRHVIFIEEAHNIIASDTQQAGSDSVDPKISATAYIVKMLAEVRALREAIVIADQLPTALATEVTKNTGLKLVHRLTAQDDREQIGESISASPLQLEQMTTFTKGKALIYHEKTQKPYIVQVAEWKKPKIDYDFSNDKELYKIMFYQNNMLHAIDCAMASWEEKVFFPFCDQANEFVSNFAYYIKEGVAKKERENILKACKRVQKKCIRLKKLWLGDGGTDNYLYDEKLENSFKEKMNYLYNLEKDIAEYCRLKGE